LWEISKAIMLKKHQERLRFGRRERRGKTIVFRKPQGVRQKAPTDRPISKKKTCVKKKRKSKVQ